MRLFKKNTSTCDFLFTKIVLGPCVRRHSLIFRVSLVEFLSDRNSANLRNAVDFRNPLFSSLSKKAHLLLTGNSRPADHISFSYPHFSSLLRQEELIFPCYERFW